MQTLSEELIKTLNSGLSKLTGYKRRQYAAEICHQYFDSSATKMERHLKVGRKMVNLALHEHRTGIRCLEAFHLRGAKKKKSKMKI